MTMTTADEVPTLGAGDRWDYAPLSLDATSRPPRPYPRVVLYIVLALFTVMLVWAIFGRLDIVAVAQGKLVPQSYLKVVQPAESGIVTEILVHEGDVVAAGDVLMRMDTRYSDADRNTLQAELEMKRLQVQRIDTELTGRAMTRGRSVPPVLFAQIEAQAHARRQAYQDALATEQAVLAKAKHDARAAAETEAKLQQTAPLFREQEEAWRKLTNEGFAGKLYLNERQRQRIENEQDLRAQQNAVESFKATIVQSEKRLAQITSSYRQQLQDERVDATAQLAKLEQDWEKQEHRHGLLELRAPQSGTVKDLATHTTGTVVQPGAILATLVPRDEPLIAEIWVSNLDAGFVLPGQPVRVKLAAFPFQKYGMLDGRITHISADSTDRPDAAPQAEIDAAPSAAQPHLLHYRALVALDAQTLAREHRRLTLSPGMQTTAEIVLGTRTILEYLLSPVQKTMNEAWRER